MSEIKNELRAVYDKYINFDFISHYKKISESCVNVKYSKGISFNAGLFEPSFVDEMRITNVNIGKEVTNIEKGYDFKYYFDDENRIILSEKYLDKKLACLNFYFYFGNESEYVFYDLSIPCIYKISKSYYDDVGRITRYIEADDILIGIDGVHSFEEHLFRYENDATYVTQNEYNNLNDTGWLTSLFPNLKISVPDVYVVNMMIKENVLYYLDDEGKIREFYNIRFKLENGKKISVPLPKKVPIFKIIKENIIKILSEWENADKTVIWILCRSSDLVMQYTTMKEECEAKWNIAFYDTDEKEIFTDKSHVQVLEDLLFNNGCNIDDLINESEYFTNKMIKIIKELRKEGYIADDTAVILSKLEISENTLEIAKKINDKEVIKGFFTV